MKWKEFEAATLESNNNRDLTTIQELQEIVGWMHRCGVLLHFDEVADEQDDGTVDDIDISSSSEINISNDSKQPELQSSYSISALLTTSSTTSSSPPSVFHPESLVILGPQWLADVFKKVIDHNTVERVNERKDGILSDQLFCELWKVYQHFLSFLYSSLSVLLMNESTSHLIHLPIPLILSLAGLSTRYSSSVEANLATI